MSLFNQHESTCGDSSFDLVISLSTTTQITMILFTSKTLKKNSLILLRSNGIPLLLKNFK